MPKEVEKTKKNTKKKKTRMDAYDALGAFVNSGQKVDESALRPYLERFCTTPVSLDKHRKLLFALHSDKKKGGATHEYLISALTQFKNPICQLESEHQGCDVVQSVCTTPEIQQKYKELLEKGTYLLKETWDQKRRNYMTRYCETPVPKVNEILGELQKQSFSLEDKTLLENIKRFLQTQYVARYQDTDFAYKDLCSLESFLLLRDLSRKLKLQRTSKPSTVTSTTKEAKSNPLILGPSSFASKKPILLPITHTLEKPIKKSPPALLSQTPFGSSEPLYSPVPIAYWIALAVKQACFYPEIPEETWQNATLVDQSLADFVYQLLLLTQSPQDARQLREVFQSLITLGYPLVSPPSWEYPEWKPSAQYSYEIASSTCLYPGIRKVIADEDSLLLLAVPNYFGKSDRDSLQIIYNVLTKIKLTDSKQNTILATKLLYPFVTIGYQTFGDLEVAYNKDPTIYYRNLALFLPLVLQQYFYQDFENVERILIIIYANSSHAQVNQNLLILPTKFIVSNAMIYAGLFRKWKIDEQLVLSFLFASHNTQVNVGLRNQVHKEIVGFKPPKERLGNAWNKISTETKTKFNQLKVSDISFSDDLKKVGLMLREIVRELHISFVKQKEYYDYDKPYILTLFAFLNYLQTLLNQALYKPLSFSPFGYLTWEFLSSKQFGLAIKAIPMTYRRQIDAAKPYILEENSVVLRSFQNVANLQELVAGYKVYALASTERERSQRASERASIDSLSKEISAWQLSY